MRGLRNRTFTINTRGRSWLLFVTIARDCASHSDVLIFRETIGALICDPVCKSEKP